LSGKLKWELSDQANIELPRIGPTALARDATLCPNPLTAPNLQFGAEFAQSTKQEVNAVIPKEYLNNKPVSITTQAATIWVCNWEINGKQKNTGTMPAMPT